MSNFHKFRGAATQRSGATWGPSTSRTASLSSSNASTSTSRTFAHGSEREVCSSALEPPRLFGVFAGANRRAVAKLREQRAQAKSLCPSHQKPQPGDGHVLHAVATAVPAFRDLPSAVSNMRVVNVDLGDRSYPIYIGPGLLKHQGELLRQHIPGKRVLVVTNETIAPLYLEDCLRTLTADGKLQADVVILPDGEEHKSMEVLGQVWDKALECRLDRGATFLALGGGVIGDMTGFAAACYQRGVHFVQVPTTVMSQVDSSVGGKTGVNHPLGKNMIGAFYQPQVVLIDTDTLSTLPDRELASGLSEVIKYGLIRDARLFEWLEANMERLLARDADAMAYAIEQSCINKAEVVAADERETNDVRATLNLGHTFGHAMETGQGYGVWLHGEAVSAGIVMAADMSHRLGWIDKALLDRTVSLLVRAKLPVKPPPQMTVAQFKSLMSVDKKVSAGKLRLVLLRGPLGGCVVTGEFDAAVLDQTLHAFCDK